MFRVKLKVHTFVPKSSATFTLTSTLYDILFHLQARRVTVRVDHHTYSLLISKAYLLFREFLYTY